jgi:hypothetical protein
VRREQLVLGLPWFGMEWTLLSGVEGTLRTNASAPAGGGPLLTTPTALVDPAAGRPAIITIAAGRNRVAAHGGEYNEAAAAWWYYVPAPDAVAAAAANGTVNATAAALAGQAKLGWVEDGASFAAKVGCQAPHSDPGSI